jgi:post-segregation antitoxin (ccd killing protein)
VLWWNFGMEIRVNIPDELAAQARARGLELEAYVEEVLASRVAPRSTANQQLRTPEEFQAWLESVAQFSDKTPPLPETISRECIYQDHN